MATANDIAWEKLLSSSSLRIDDSIDTHGYCDITADQIRNLGHREPRLACKHDFRAKIPRPLSERGVSVLAIANGNYRLARTDPFIDIQDNDVSLTNPLAFRCPGNLEFLDPNHLSSESKALDAAFLSGILNEALEEDSLDLVLRGRERTLEFEFELPATSDQVSHLVSYPVKGVTIEVDGGYEGDKSLHLVEAKLWTEQSSMNIRQLLYPHLHYRQKAKKKSVATHLMFYDPGTSLFRFYKFRLDEFENLSAWDPADVKEYRLLREDSKLKFQSLFDTEISAQWLSCKVPFPQADSFAKILHLFGQLLLKRQSSRDELFSELDMQPRQYDYYGNALCWLGLAERNAQYYSLTSFGRELSKMATAERLFRIARVVYSNGVFHAFLRDSFDLAKQRLSKQYSGQTVTRRLVTVAAWTRYFKRAFDPIDQPLI